MLRWTIALMLAAVLAACASARPDETTFADAERAIQAAERAGGDNYAPVEMRFAREKLAEAREGVEKRQYDVAWYLIEQAEINSELAIEKSRTGEERDRVARQRQLNDELATRFENEYGEDFR